MGSNQSYNHVNQSYDQANQSYDQVTQSSYNKLHNLTDLVYDQNYQELADSLCVDSDPEPSYKALAPLGYVSGFFIAVCGIIINSMTIFVIIKQRHFLKKHRIVPLLFYVTFFELLDCVYGIPLQAFKFYFEEWPISPVDETEHENWRVVCETTFAPFAIMFQMSVYLLLLITINRALSLYDQSRASGWFNWKYTSVLVFLVSLLSSYHILYKHFIICSTRC